MARIDRDRLFKELLESFFAEFLALFFPEAHAAVDLSHLRFLPQEVFTDVTAGEKHVVDILAETRLKGEEGLILVHVENQARIQPDFNERMFIYFSRLYQKFRRRILPIAVFSYDQVYEEPDLVPRQVRKRFGEVPAELEQALRSLSREQIEALGEALLDAKNLEELRAMMH